MIILDYVPGGCTGLFQPCDVGIQKLFKAAIRRAQHNDIVQETIQQLDSGVRPQDVKLDTRLGVLRNCSVSWLVEAYHAINKPEIVLKVYQLIFYFHFRSNGVIRPFEPVESKEQCSTCLKNVSQAGKSSSC